MMTLYIKGIGIFCNPLNCLGKYLLLLCINYCWLRSLLKWLWKIY